MERDRDRDRDSDRDLFGMILEVNNEAVFILRPSRQRAADRVLDVSGETGFVQRRFQERADECVHSLVQGAVHLQDGILPKQLRHRFRIRRHEYVAVVQQHNLVHLRVRRYYDWFPQQVCLEHLPIPIHHPTTHNPTYIILIIPLAQTFSD